MKEANPTVLEFESESDAKTYISSMFGEFSITEDISGERNPENIEFEDSASLTDSITTKKILNNEHGTTRKKGVGVQMRVTGSSSWKILVKIDAILESGEVWEDDISQYGYQCVEFFVYYSWWSNSKNSWVMVNDGGHHQAQPGQYFPTVGARWVPK